VRVEVRWDPTKNALNCRNHGLSFEDVAELFTSGVDYLELFDCLHSDDEDRFLAVGPVARGVVLVVHTVQDEDVIRIISARKATSAERHLFLEYMENRL